MRRTLRLMALALTVASAAFLAPVAHAQDPQLPDLSAPPAADALPAPDAQPFFNPGNSTDYAYYDSDGWGTLNVSSVYGAYGTGLPLIKCKLQQNGHSLYASGIYYNGYMIYCISNYVFQCHPTGYGSYHQAGSPNYQKAFYLKKYR